MASEPRRTFKPNGYGKPDVRYTWHHIYYCLALTECPVLLNAIHLVMLYPGRGGRREGFSGSIHSNRVA